MNIVHCDDTITFSQTYTSKELVGKKVKYHSYCPELEECIGIFKIKNNIFVIEWEDESNDTIVFSKDGYEVIKLCSIL